jgi:hypothetical protein
MRLVASVAALMVATASVAGAQITEADTGWPRELVTDSGTMIIYQPQPDKLDGITLTGRAAVSVLPKGSKEPVFGVVWFTARAQTDRDDRTVDIDQIAVTNVRFTGESAAQALVTRAMVNPKLTQWQFTIALDRLMASLAEAEVEQRSADSLNTTPPAIIFTSTPSALLLYDGQPLLRKVDNSTLQRVVNTPMLVLFDAAAKTYYLNGGPLWYSASSALGPWVSVKGKIPADVAAMVPDSVQSGSEPPGGPPAIVVATAPTELIVTDGAAKWAPVTGTDLLYVTNTDRDVFRTIDTPQLYVLLAGRWFRATTDKGPWTFVRPDALPPAFAKIPPASAKADVLVSVPGTTEADEALMDTQIPQTAAIDRRTATLTVSYAGAPVFQQVTGTSVAYATNTDTKVLRINGMYYACDQAVWFVSNSAKGPWVVSDSVPKAVQTIPPSSPVYNVKYVQVYQATPTVVYVGYTPGYTWAFPYYGTVVYGTGYVYPAYISPVVYYPPPVTYGVAVRYNPWTGWTVGFGYGTPFLYSGVVVVGPRYGGWYGPYGRPPYPPPYYRPPYYGYPGYRPPPPGYRPPPPGYRPPPGAPRPTPYAGQNNIYGQPQNRTRNAPPATVGMSPPKARPVNGGANNVVGGKDGNVYRRDGQNWQTREGNQWKPATGSTGTTGGVQRPTNPTSPTTRPATPTSPTARPTTPTTRPTTPTTRPAPVPSDVSRDYQSRERGQQRTQTYNNGAGRAPQSQQPRPAPQSRPAPQKQPTGGAGGRR